MIGGNIYCLCRSHPPGVPPDSPGVRGWGHPQGPFRRLPSAGQPGPLQRLPTARKARTATGREAEGDDLVFMWLPETSAGRCLVILGFAAKPLRSRPVGGGGVGCPWRPRGPEREEREGGRAGGAGEGGGRGTMAVPNSTRPACLTRLLGCRFRPRFVVQTSETRSRWQWKAGSPSPLCPTCNSTDAGPRGRG